MATPRGIALFPGAVQIVGADFTLSHGISPSVCTLQIAPQRNFAGEGGTLEFVFGSVRLRFHDCKVDRHSFRRNGSGEIWSLAILDRRWKWRYGEVNGVFNTAFADGTLDQDREKDPQSLAVMCLLAMGESRFDVSSLPNEARPEVHWEGIVPAQALADLVEQLGCRVVLKLDGTVSLERLGVGAELPRGNDAMENSLTIDPPERPERLVVLCGPTRYQFEFKLRAVGLETDGSIIPIDDLSYKPAGGWSTQAPGLFLSIEDRNERELALRSVFRWYRIYTNSDGTSPLDLPGFGKVKNGWQMAPIEDVQVATYEDAGVQPPDGEARNKINLKASIPAEVFGVFFRSDFAFANTAEDSEYKRGFRILKEEALVAFDDYVWQMSNEGRAEPATLYLRASCSVREPNNWAWSRHRRERRIGDPSVPTGARVLHHPEIVLTYRPDYEPFGRTVQSLHDNLEAVNVQCDYYLDAAEAEYQTPLPSDVTYAGIKAISPDGAIQQISWSVGQGGATTRASRNSEFSIRVPSYEERRMFEQLQGRKLTQLARALEKRQQPGRGVAR